MDMEQILKQLEWLDEERRKDKTRLGAFEERLNNLDGTLPPLVQQLKDQGGDITRLAALYTRMDNLDQAMLQLRLDSKQSFEDMDRQLRKREEETDKLRHAELHSLETALADLRKEFKQVGELKRNMKARLEEETRLARMIDEERTRMETVRRDTEEFTRTARLMDESRRQDAKRLTDLQGEVAALRKRLDDQIGKIDLASVSTKKVETRINELVAVESERREAVSSFLNSQALRDVERERNWKEWQTHFQTIETQAVEIEKTLQELDAAQLSLKRSQQAIDELSQKVERRISELTEMQRLSEERFRQEWVIFKADDQKRWINYTLTTDEQRGEVQRRHERLAERITSLDDENQGLQDKVEQINELTEQRLQGLLAALHEWVTSFERTFGRNR